MSSRRGRNRNSGAVSDRREDDSKGSPEKSESSLPEIPLSYQYETEDGLMIEVTPTSATASREYQLSENDYLEFDAGVEWDIIDIDVARDGRGTDISGSVGLPGDILGVGGGVEIDLSTGEITGGDISLEAATVGLDIEVSRGGCEVSIGLSVLGFGATYTRDECEDEEEKEDRDEDSEKDKEQQRGKNLEDLDALEGYEDSLPSGCQISLLYYAQRRYDENPETGLLELTNEAGGTGPEFNKRHPKRTFVDAVGNVLQAHTVVWTNNAFGVFEYGADPDWRERAYRLSGGISYIREVFSNPEGGNPDYRQLPWKFQGLQVWGCRNKLPRGPKRKDDVDKKEPPGKPPMKEKECCSESIKLMREIHKALDVRELLDNQLIVPNRLIAPNAKGSAKLKSYLEISQWLMRMMDHLGIHPFKASLTDANAAKAGNQKVELQFVSGTAALQQVLKLLLENKGDAAARLNLQVRSAVALAQILKVATITSKTATAIADFIGMPLKEKIAKIKMPFDVSLGKRRQLKGFDPKNQREQAIEAIGLNEEASTEEILPEFLQTGEQPYVSPYFDGSTPTLSEQIQGKNNNG